MKILNSIKNIPNYIYNIDYRSILKEIKRRIRNIFIGCIDQPIWVLLSFGNGSPDESISAAAYRLWEEDKIMGKILKPTIDYLLRFLGKDHCYHAYSNEMARKQLPKKYRY